MNVPDGFAPHPEGGWFRETWRSDLSVSTPRGPRSSATAISYLLGPGQVSAWHRVRGAGELWIWTGGGALELTVGGTGPRPADPRTVVVGPGAQHLVEPHEWQTARPVGEAVQCTCVVSPGFDFQDFELARDADVPAPAEPAQAARPATSWRSTLEPLRAEPVEERPLSVLLVCQANMCRSPIAHALLAKELADRDVPNVQVSSAGLRTVDGSAMDPMTARTLARYGVRDMAAFRTRRFTPDLADADLVLTATTAQRDELVRRAPQARDRTFSWRELAALIGAERLTAPSAPTAAARMAEAMRQIADRRGLVQPEVVGGFDVGDPIGRPAKVFDRIGDDIAASMATVAGLLGSAAQARSAA